MNSTLSEHGHAEFDEEGNAVPMMSAPTGLFAELSTRLIAVGLDPLAVERLVRATLAEDLDGGIDVTTAATVPADQRRVADVEARADGVLAGLPVAELVFAIVVGEDRVKFQRFANDGEPVQRGDVVLSVEGPTLDLLTAERTALNLLCHLSGVATLTARWVVALEGTGAAVRDTRKTTPLLRRLEKYAVRCGGGVNHRMSLSDAALIKDNHVLAAGGVAQAYLAVRARFPEIPVEVEVDTVDDAIEAVEAGATLVLLDNMSPALMREAVVRVAGRAKLEASGGLTLATAREVGLTGVDYLAVGALTHSAPVLDLALDLRGTGELLTAAGRGETGTAAGRGEMDTAAGRGESQTNGEPGDVAVH